MTNDKPARIELLPCPFCGSAAAEPYSNGYTFCTACYPVKCPMLHLESAVPVDVWNTRATPQPSASAVEAVNNAFEKAANIAESTPKEWTLKTEKQRFTLQQVEIERRRVGRMIAEDIRKALLDTSKAPAPVRPNAESFIEAYFYPSPRRDLTQFAFDEVKRVLEAYAAQLEASQTPTMADDDVATRIVQILGGTREQWQRVSAEIARHRIAAEKAARARALEEAARVLDNWPSLGEAVSVIQDEIRNLAKQENGND